MSAEVSSRELIDPVAIRRRLMLVWCSVGLLHVVAWTSAAPGAPTALLLMLLPTFLMQQLPARMRIGPILGSFLAATCQVLRGLYYSREPSVGDWWVAGILVALSLFALVSLLVARRQDAPSQRNGSGAKATDPDI